MNLQLDQASLDMMKMLYPGFRDDLLNVLNIIAQTTNINLRLTCGFRNISEQQKIYNQGRTSPGKIVTNAEPFQTFHNYGLAADFCFRGNDPYLDISKNAQNIWQQVGLIAANNNLTWGGTFKFQDKPHLENNYGLYWENCQSMVEENGLATLWAFLDKKRGVPQGYEWNNPIPGLYSE